MRVFVLLCALLVACGPVSSSGTGSIGSSSTDAGPPPDTDGGAVQGGIDAGRPARLFGLRITANGPGPSQSSPAGSQFDGWGGACTGAGSCAVTMNREQIVAARFQPVAPPPQKLAYSITEVPAVPGSTSLLAIAIDGRGDIVGTYYVPNKSGDVDVRAFLYDASKGTTQRIGGNDGSTIQMANGVNDSLAVAPSTDARPGLHQQGSLWRDIGQTDIGALPPGPNGPQTGATAVNQRGWITGWSLGAKNFQR